MAMQTLSMRFLGEDGGATAIEYAMIAGGVALVIIAAINAIGGAVLSDIASANIF
jgi:pilus assembly protein Flp/PilA